MKKDEFVRLKSKVEYKEDVEITQVPESAKTLKLDIKMNYDLDDGTGISVKDNGVKITPIANGSLDAIGTIVTIGSGQFYTIGTEGDNVKLLSMYNLYVGGEYNLNTYGWKAYGEEATGMQDSTMLGYVSGQSIRKGTTAFSTNSTSYNGSIVEEYVNNYKIKLEEKFGLAVTESRLIVKEELLSLGCTLDNTTCKNAPSWVWTSSYWTGTAYDSIQVFNVNNDSSFMKNVYSYDAVERFGVRPVIIMLKDDIGKEIFNFTIDGVTYQAEVEMTWDEWIDSKYNVDGFTATYNNSCKSGLGVYYGTGILTTQLISGEFIDNTKIYSFNYSVEPTPDYIVGLCIKK